MLLCLPGYSIDTFWWRSDLMALFSLHTFCMLHAQNQAIYVIMLSIQRKAFFFFFFFLLLSTDQDNQICLILAITPCMGVNVCVSVCVLQHWLPVSMSATASLSATIALESYCWAIVLLPGLWYQTANSNHNSLVLLRTQFFVYRTGGTVECRIYCKV